VWIGSGLEGIDGLTAGDSVTAEQTQALFGLGLHPLIELRQQLLARPDLTPARVPGLGLARGTVQDH
jgi:hypothetical protein